jgi:hypothetical protein
MDGMEDESDPRADLILDQYRDLIEWHWLEAGRRGMGPRYIQAVEVPRPDGLLAFAFRPTPWNPVIERICPWDEEALVVLIRLVGGVSVRAIPHPVDDGWSPAAPH